MIWQKIWILCRRFIAIALYPLCAILFYERFSRGIGEVSIWDIHIVIFSALAIYCVWKERSSARADEIELQNARKESRSLSNKNSELTDALDFLGGDKLWSFYMRTLGEELRLGNQERISLYCYSEKAKAFIMLGRHSKNPELNATGRKVYRADQGCIGAAWRDGDCLESYWPDPVKNPTGYAKKNEKYGYTPEDLSTLTMLPRSVYAKALEHPETGRCAIVLAESLSGKRFLGEIRGEVVVAPTFTVLERVLPFVKDRLPSLDQPQEMGY